MSRQAPPPNTTWDLFAPPEASDGLRSITLLANQLATLQGHRVRLFIDDPLRLSAMSARIDPALWLQPVANFDLARLRLAAGVATADHVVCLHDTQIPRRYHERMAYGAANRCKQFRIWPIGHPVHSFHEAARLSACSTVEIDVLQDEQSESMGLIKDTRNTAEMRTRWKAHPHLTQTTLEHLGLPGEISRDTFIVCCWEAALADAQGFVEALAHASDSPRVLLLVGPGTSQLMLNQRLGVVECVKLPALSWSQIDEIVWSCDLLLTGERDLAQRAMEAGTPMMWLPKPSPSNRDEHLLEWYYAGVDPGFRRRLLVVAHSLREENAPIQELGWYLKQRVDLDHIASQVARRIGEARSLFEQLPHLSPIRLEQARRKKQEEEHVHAATWPMNLTE